MKVQLNKKYRYRNGEPARVLCVDAPGSQKVVTVDSAGKLHKHWGDGSYHLDSNRSGYDLIEAREPLECWLWVEGSTIMGYSPSDKKETPKHRLFREVID